MKKITIGALAALFVICGIGAVLLLNKGNEAKRAEDHTPKIQGLKDITIQAGEKLPDTIKEISANAAVQDVTVDISRVDATKPGEYPITYIYADAEGKEYKKEITCTVAEPGESMDEASPDAVRDTAKDTEQTESETLISSGEETAQEGTVQEETAVLSVPKTGDSDWQMAVHILLLMISSAVLTSACYLRAKRRKI